MSLVKLLSAAKSLDGSKPAASPYRMKSGSRLPKFGSGRNPFAAPRTTPDKTTAKDEPGQLQTGSLFESDADGAVEQPVERLPEPKPAPKSQSDSPPEAQSGPQDAADREPPAPKETPAAKPDKARGGPQAKPGKLVGILKRMNPLTYLPKRRPLLKNRPKAARVVVQGELSLDKVVVLRNELNDSDLEFVTAKPAKNEIKGSILPSAPRPRPTVWEELSSRVLKPVETQAH